MSERALLEGRLRRVLACYPRPFRREHEEEILAVLMAGVEDGRRRAGWAASADLIRAAASCGCGEGRHGYPAGCSPRPG
jgi:hypothetical protein